MKQPILHLNLHKKWFDMIYKGIKTEEYREVKPFYERIFDEHGRIKVKGIWYCPEDVILCFSNGYKKDRPQKLFFCDGLRLGYGKKEWGAPETPVFILQVGEEFI